MEIIVYFKFSTILTIKEQFILLILCSYGLCVFIPIFFFFLLTLCMASISVLKFWKYWII